MMSVKRFLKICVRMHSIHNSLVAFVTCFMRFRKLHGAQNIWSIYFQFEITIFHLIKRNVG